MPAVPKGAKQPTDRAAKAEAKGEDITFDHEGVTYTIARENADDVELFEHIEQDHVLTAMKGFLGAKQWDAWKDLNRGPGGKVSFASLDSFMDAVLGAIGGNS